MTATLPAVLLAPLCYQWWKDHLRNHMERERHHPANPRFGDRDRYWYLTVGLGCSLPGSEDWWPMVSSRTTTHQCAGNESRDTCSLDFHEGPMECPCRSKNGKHVSPGQMGGDLVPQLDESSLWDVGLLSPERCHPFGFSPARSEKSDYGLGIQGSADFCGVEI